jgi:hypothetical protein
MNPVTSFVIIFLMGAFRSRLSLQSENAALRHQLSVYRRAQRRPAIAFGDRLLWSLVHGEFLIGPEILVKLGIRHAHVANRPRGV